MAQKKRKASKTTHPTRRPTDFGGTESSAADFDDIQLPGEVSMPEEEEAEFDEVDVEAAALGAEPRAEALSAAKEQLERQLLLTVTEQALAADSGTEAHGFENIVGVGIGDKMIDDHFTNERTVIVYVVAKAPKDEVQAEALVPEEIGGVPTDVVAIGELHALPFKGRYRPAPCGVSIGHYRITAGTFGCLVRRGRSLFILSNNHVLANSNNARIGDPIVQPGPTDGGRVPSHVIAKLSHWVPIQFGGPLNDVDCAMAQTSPQLVKATNIAYGRFSPTPIPCRPRLVVKKGGRTTQFTRGWITDCNATLRVNYGTSGIAVFRNQIVIRSLTTSPFSAGGDSGSLIVSDVGNRPVGLLFAGSSSHTIANPITTVLTKLGVSIVA